MIGPLKRLAQTAGAFAALAGLYACEGTVPSVNGPPEQGIAAVIIGGKITLPSGETARGKMWINLEGEDPHIDRVVPETYRLIVRPQQPILYRVEPGTYHYAPARSIFGFTQPRFAIRAEGRTFQVPFPRDILRRASIEIRPTKIVSLGVVEVKFGPALPGRQPAITVHLNDSVAARRQLVQDLIHSMMDPNAAPDVRDSAVDWTRALDQTLGELTAESNRAAPYRPGP